MKEGTSIVNTEEYRELLEMKEDLQYECDEIRVGRTYVMTKKGLADYVDDKLEQMEELVTQNEKLLASIEGDVDPPNPLEVGRRLFVFGLLVVATVAIHNTLGFHPIIYMCAFLCGIAAMRVINQMILDSK